MVKNKFLLIIAVIVFLLTTFSTVCLALESGETLDSDQYIIGEDNTVINYNINGNAYIIAKDVTISSKVDGDVFVIAGNVNITEEGQINNLFALGENININGKVSTVYTCADTVTINKGANILRDLFAGMNSFNFYGKISRNANIAFDYASFKDSDNVVSGQIEGNLNYSSDNEQQIEDGIVKGSTNFVKNEVKETKKGKTLYEYLTSLATFIATVFIVNLVILWLRPQFKESAKSLLKTKPFPVLGAGALALIATPVAVIMLMIFGVTIKVSFALLLLYLFALIVATSVFIISLAEIVVEKYNIEAKYRQWGIVSLLAIAMWLIKQLPIIGAILSFIVLLFGTGIMVKTLKYKSE